MTRRLAGGLLALLALGGSASGAPPSARTLLESWIANARDFNSVRSYRLQGKARETSLDEKPAQNGTWAILRDGAKLRYDGRMPAKEVQTIAFDGELWSFFGHRPGETDSGSIFTDPARQGIDPAAFWARTFPIRRPWPEAILRHPYSAGSTVPLASELLRYANRGKVRPAGDGTGRFLVTFPLLPNTAGSAPFSIEFAPVEDRFLPFRVHHELLGRSGQKTGKYFEMVFGDYVRVGSALVPQTLTYRDNILGRDREAAFQSIRLTDVNRPIPASEFSVRWTPGMDVYDDRIKRWTRAEAQGLRPLTDEPAKADPPPAKSPTVLYYALAGGGVIAIGGTLLLRRRRR